VRKRPAVGTARTELHGEQCRIYGGIGSMSIDNSKPTDLPSETEAREFGFQARIAHTSMEVGQADRQFPWLSDPILRKAFSEGWWLGEDACLDRGC
jgi:hypothetical protein